MSHPRSSDRCWATVDVVLFTVQPASDLPADVSGRPGRLLKVLLVQRNQEPFRGLWALPGGFIQSGETLDQAAKRELLERTGVADAYLEQLYTYGDPDRDPRARVVTVAYYGLVGADHASLDAEAGRPAARWFSLDTVPQLAFDHQGILALAAKRLRNKMDYTMLAFKLLPKEWTRTELRQTYEAILGCDLGSRDPVNKRNFEKWVRQMMDRGHIAPTGRERKPAGRGKPAPLYRWQGSLTEGERPPLPDNNHQSD